MDPFLGEIRLLAFNFAPTGWAECNGAILSIAQNTALYSLLGTMYGGNGVSTFALPDLRGRVPIGQGQGPGLPNFIQGQVGGTETVTLLSNQLPAHNHAFSVPASQGLPTVNSPAGAVLAAGAGAGAAKYALETPDTTLAAGQTGFVGNSQPVAIRDPYVALKYCIALQGIFPSRP